MFQKEITTQGKRLFVDLVRMEGDEFVTVSQAATMFGVTYRNIHKHLKNHNLTGRKIVDQSINDFKDQGLVDKRAREVVLLGKDTVRQLVRVINTQQAKEVYNLLWEVAERADHFYQKQAASIDPLDVVLNTILAVKEHNRRTELVQAEHNSRIEAVEQKTSPEALKAVMGEAIIEQSRFPQGCTPMADIRRLYFFGIAEKMIRDVLDYLNHPWEYYRIHIEDTNSYRDGRAYRTKGLTAASELFLEEVKLSKMTDTNYIYYHQGLGRNFYKPRHSGPLPLIDKQLNQIS